MTRKRFLLKCILVMLPVIGVSLYTRNHLMDFADEETPYYIWNKQFCSTTQDQSYDVIILGDSTANASYMPEALSSATVNLALGGTTPIENYYTMKDWLRNHEAPKAVYISFMDYHMNMCDGYWNRSMYSHRYAFRQNWEMLQNAKKYGEVSMVTENCNLDFWAYELYLPNKYITSLMNAGFNQRYEGNMNIYYDDELHKGRYIAKGNVEWDVEPIEFSNFYAAPMIDAYYRKLIELCVENNIQVHLVKLPLSDSQTFTDEYKEQFQEYYNSIKEEYPEIAIDWLESYEGYCFADSLHMNTHGALKLSKEIRNMYPEEFGAGYSDGQIQALNDNICNENMLTEMFGWAECGPYTFVVYDTVGNFKEACEDVWRQKGLICSEKMLTEEETSKVYVIGSSHMTSALEAISLSDEMLEINLTSGESYEWNPYELHGVNMVVIDEYNGNIVCEKRFGFAEGSFVVQ